MADTEDLVALILSALGAASESELCILSELLASESSLQLRRLWLLVGSRSRCLSIIAFLDSLSHDHRRLLVARVTLRLVCRITDFLEDPAASTFSQEALDSSAAHLVHRDRAPQSSFLEPPISDWNKEDVTASVEGTTIVVPTYGENASQQKEKGSKKSLSVNSKHAELPHQELSSMSQSSSQKLDMRNQMLNGVCVAELSQCLDNVQTLETRSKNKDGSESLAKPGVKNTEGRLAQVDLEGPFHAPLEPVIDNFASANVANTDTRNASMEPASMSFEYVDSASHLLASTNSYASSSMPTYAGLDLWVDMPSTSYEDEMDNLSLPWGETDAAFLFLFLWETQEQECQEAMQRWCVDPFVYHLLIVQDMSVLVDDEMKARRIRAPRWRERLKQYLLQNVLQVGYGFPGVMASANLPASLSAYIDTIGRFQRVLNSMNLDESSEPKLPAASEATLHTLPTTVIGLSSEDKGKVCIICKEELEPSSVASQLPCMHVYHWDCILSWLKQRNNCPVCRHELPTDDYDHELQKKIQILRERIALNT